MSDCFHYGTDSPHDTPECYPCCKHCHACGVKLDDSTPPDCPGVVKCPQCDRRVANQNDEGIHNTGECTASPEQRIELLTKAGALIAAEIDRLLRTKLESKP